MELSSILERLHHCSIQGSMLEEIKHMHLQVNLVILWYIKRYLPCSVVHLWLTCPVPWFTCGSPAPSRGSPAQFRGSPVVHLRFTCPVLWFTCGSPDEDDDDPRACVSVRKIPYQSLKIHKKYALGLFGVFRASFGFFWVLLCSWGLFGVAN